MIKRCYLGRRLNEYEHYMPLQNAPQAIFIDKQTDEETVVNFATDFWDEKEFWEFFSQNDFVSCKKMPYSLDYDVPEDWACFFDIRLKYSTGNFARRGLGLEDWTWEDFVGFCDANINNVTCLPIICKANSIPQLLKTLWNDDGRTKEDIIPELIENGAFDINRFEANAPASKNIPWNDMPWQYIDKYIDYDALFNDYTNKNGFLVYTKYKGMYYLMDSENH